MSEDKLEESLSDLDLSIDTNHCNHRLVPKNEGGKIGVDQLMRKESKIFGVGIKMSVCWRRV